MSNDINLKTESSRTASTDSSSTLKSIERSGAVTPARSLSTQLQIGEKVTGKVLQHWPESNLAKIEIKGQQILAAVNKLPLAMTKIQLEVISLGDQPQLRLLNMPSAGELSKIIALKNYLPIQQSTQTFFQQLQNIPESLKSSPNGKLLQSFSMPTVNDLSQGAGLAQWALKSGVFMESMLLHKGCIQEGDFKQQLMQYIHKLKSGTLDRQNALLNSEKQLLNQAESTLAGIIVNQLRSLKNDTADTTVLINLPFWADNEIENLYIAIHQDDPSEQPADSGDSSSNLSCTINFSLSKLGKIQARIAGSQENLTIRISCENADTAALFNDNMEKLEHQLNKAGLKTRSIAVINEVISETQVTQLSMPLINERV